MYFFSVFTFAILHILAVFVSTNEAVQRNLNYSVNPGCDLSECQPGGVNNTYLNVVVVQASGKDDVIHYLWSTYKHPTIIIARTNHTATLNIDWENLLHFKEHAITFSEAPLHSVAFIINKLWEFNDEDDNVNMRLSPNVSSLDLTKLYWDNITASLLYQDTFIKAAPKGHNNGSVFSDDGDFSVQFSVSAEDKPSDEYPHLWFTSCSSEMKLLLSGLRPTFKSSRFAVEVIAISSALEDTHWHSESSISFDDEYSPGVFKVEKLYSQCHNVTANCEGFVSWKPVSYIGEKPTVANSSDATASNYQLGPFPILGSIATSYFHLDPNISVAAWNMTFGTNGDGFYKKTRYTAWSVMIGVGEPITDKVSILAIIVISVGLGAPLLIMAGGGIYLGYKKCGRKDDDLLLEG